MLTIKHVLNSAVLAITALASLASDAAPTPTIVWDQSPAATGGIYRQSWASQYSTASNVEHIADRFSLQSATTLTGMDVYIASATNFIGARNIFVEIYRDNAGVPGATLSQRQTAAPVKFMDHDGGFGAAYPNSWRLHFDFAEQALEGGSTYWISMAGLGDFFSLNTMAGASGGDGQVARFTGTSFYQMFPIGDLAFRLYGYQTDTGNGQGNTLPTPGSTALSLLALATMAAVRRRNR